MSSADTVLALAAKQEIHEALLRYLRGVDRCDPELISSAFHPTAIDEHGGLVWLGKDVGDQIVGRGRDVYKGTLHVVGNHLIELAGEVAYSEAYTVCYLQREDERGDHLVVRALRYIDRFESRNGEWKIAHRKTIREWDRIDRITEKPPDAAYFAPTRTPQDLSYQAPADSRAFASRTTEPDN